MTVAELINRLQELDPTLDVLLPETWDYNKSQMSRDLEKVEMCIEGYGKEAHTIVSLS